MIKDVQTKEIMPWKFGNFGGMQDFLKKKACRFFLQHYLGQFLKQKLSLDQLSLDLYNGNGKITDLNLDVQAVNDELSSLGVPVELVDGFVECISVTVPWSALVNDSTRLEVTGLELTLQPIQREDNGMMAGEMFSSMHSSMTASLQLAKECLEADKEGPKSDPIEGVQNFAFMIDSVLSKIRVTLNNTVIRLEHKPIGAERGVALEVRIRRIEYFDEMATTSDGTSVDDNASFEPAAFVLKNLHLEGVQLYYDEIGAQQSPSRSCSSLWGSPTQMFLSARSMPASGEYQSMSKSDADHPPALPEPNQVAIVTGRQEIRLKLKQNDALHGPKLEINCQFGGVHVLLCPRQLHGLMELLSTLTTSDPANEKARGRSNVQNRPMKADDLDRVQCDLQHQLQSGRIQSNNLASLQEYSLLGEEDDRFHSMAGPGPGSDMESSFSSNYSATSTRTSSTAPSGTSLPRQNSRGPRDQGGSSKFREDPSAELSHYRIRVAFFSVSVLHSNPSVTPDLPNMTPLEMMKAAAGQFFQRVGGVTAAGMTQLKDICQQMSGLLTQDHLRLLGRPLTLECNQRSAMRQVSTTLQLTVGVAELVETLYPGRGVNTQPQYSEIVSFIKDGSELPKSSLLSSMQGGAPCFCMQVSSYTGTKQSSRHGSLPEVNVKITLGEMQLELDVTIIDRITSLTNPEKVVTPRPMPGASMYYTLGHYSISEALNEGSSGREQKLSLEVTSPLVAVNVRFPIPDLRRDSHVDKSWYRRNLRDDFLTLQMQEALVLVKFNTSQELEEVQISCSEINGYYKYSQGDASLHFAHVLGEGGGFNNPMIQLQFCNSTPSVLEDDQYGEDVVTPGDSLNGACSDLPKVEPSPFSARRHMHDRTHDSGTGSDHTEQMVLPSDREEVREFMECSASNARMKVEISLPKVCLFMPDKHFFEVLYNRLNNDMLLWEPSAPAPVKAMPEHHSMLGNVDLNVYNQLMYTGDHFEMAKSGLQLDSDSDTDSESVNLYSIHDSRYLRNRRSPRQQQSKMCLTLTIGRGRLTAFTGSKDVEGVAQSDRHGEVLIQLLDLQLFTVSAHGGDPNLQYLNILANKVDLYHNASVSTSSSEGPVVHCSELSRPVPHQLQAHKVIYRSEPGVLVNVRDPVGQGAANSLDMLTVALKIRLETITSKRELISDEVVKEFVVSVGVRGATMRYKMSLPCQSVFSQLMEFLDVKDYPILGYVDPKVLTELHVHLWTCAIDYRPEKLPVQTVILAESFTISSNIVSESAASVLRFVLEDGSLFIGKKHKRPNIDLKKDLVCVADISRLELLLRSTAGNNQHVPKTDLSISSNHVNIRTCADSLTALIELIQYVAADGDLKSADDMEDQVADPDSELNTQKADVEPVAPQRITPPLTISSVDHVNNLMSDAMMEESHASQSYSPPDSPDGSPPSLRPTEVFFVPRDDLSSDLSLGLTSREPIVITQNMDSVTSSTISALSGGDVGGEEEGEDGHDSFCLIDEQPWGKSDGPEPSIHVHSSTPIEIQDGYFTQPCGRADLLNAPDGFPLALSRYTLKELTLVWYMYGGSDLEQELNTEQEHATADRQREGMSVSYHKSSPTTNRWVGQAAGREAPLVSRETLQTRGGPFRDTSKCMEVQLTKVRFRHEVYPASAVQSSRQVFLVSDVEVRDKLLSSQLNKFLYQYSSESLPKQTYSNMVNIRAVHSRPSASSMEEECALRMSLQPLRLNIGQDTLFFLKKFFTELSGKDEPIASPGAEKTPPPAVGPAQATPPPVMSVNRSSSDDRPTEQNLLMQFDELTQDLQASFRGSPVEGHGEGSRSDTMTSSVSSSNTVTSEAGRASPPVFIKTFVFSPEVPIILDYHGKFDSEHGTLAGLGGLVSLNKVELKLKRLSYKKGLLGLDRVLKFCGNEWLTDIRVNQLPTIVGGFGPLHAFVQLGHGVKDLFWLPVEQYRRDGRLMRGLQRGASSFSMSTAMSMLELTNRLVLGIQWCAELTFDMVSPGPRKRGYFSRQPADLREGMSNAYIVLREGFSDTAHNLVDMATREHSRKGVMGAVGGVFRQIPPTLVHPLIIVPEAAANVIGGLKSQLKPEVKKEDEDKWKEEIID
ncbi:autophagy-related protein 2 homolog A-like isoform X2 [Dreissena polymorpha]|uniref:autophagy-related protein 2 homolog A-like isoform X2 n=1 Tax=Dreissena polymorpha TaxID=45954 RepID=UPI0022640A19|nr:autophagy-related protein 2 homolog A-like isoform X2 [Dreissena polymorpha]